MLHVPRLPQQGTANYCLCSRLPPTPPDSGPSCPRQLPALAAGLTGPAGLHFSGGGAGLLPPHLCHAPAGLLGCMQPAAGGVAASAGGPRWQRHKQAAAWQAAVRLPAAWPAAWRQHQGREAFSVSTHRPVLRYTIVPGAGYFTALAQHLPHQCASDVWRTHQPPKRLTASGRDACGLAAACWRAPTRLET